MDDLAIGSPQSSERTFPATVIAISQARNFVGTFASQWAFSAPRLADIQLATSELATNAVVHGRGPTFRVGLVGSVSGLQLEVESTGTATVPQIRRPMQHERTGRGLLIVSRLADRLTVHSTEVGVTLSCDFDVERPDQHRGTNSGASSTAPSQRNTQ